MRTNNKIIKTKQIKIFCTNNILQRFTLLKNATKKCNTKTHIKNIQLAYPFEFQIIVSFKIFQ